MKNALLISLLLALLQSPGWAGPTPFPASDKDWPGKGPTKVYPFMNDNRNYFWSVRDQNQGKVVFTGDSLMGGWEDLPKKFPKTPIAVRAVGGDTSRGVLFRFQEDVLDLHPKGVVILAGANDLSAYGEPDDTISNLIDMVNLAHKQDPGMPIVICTNLPRNNPKAPVKPGKQEELNLKIKQLSLNKVKILDLYPLFCKADGTQDVSYFAADFLHLSPDGYEVFRKALEPVLAELHLEQ